MGAARGTVGNDEMNSINFSTSLHRIAKTCTMFRPKNSPDYISSKQLRTQILTDPRLAILLCAVSEAFVIQKQVWNCRELSNISWALAKIDFVPNPDTIPLPPSRRQQQQSNSDVDDNIGNSQDNAILMSAKKLRESDLLAGSSKKQKTKSSDEEYAKLHKQWISQMRILGAHLLDGIALHMQHKLLPSFKKKKEVAGKTLFIRELVRDH